MVVVCFGGHVERPAAEGASHACGGNGATQAGAYHHVLPVVLCELVQVMSACELPPGHLKGNHRELHHVQPRHEVVEQLEAQRVDDVLGVVEREDLESDVVLFLEDQDPLVQRVQTV